MPATACSVVIPHFGDPAPTVGLVARLHQGLAPTTDLDVVVVDDGSPNPLGDVPGATVLRHATNRGFGHAVNTGIRATDREVVLVLNSDLLPEPGFVDDLVREASAEFPALTAPTVTEAGRPMRNETLFPGVLDMVASRSALPGLRGRTSAAEPQTLTRHGNIEVAWVSGAALCFPRSVLEEVGGFDEDFFMYLEDVDLQHRLRDRGVRRVLLERVRVEHAGAASSTSDQRREWMVDSTFVYFRKRGRLGRLAVAWLAMVGGNVAYDVLRRCAGRSVDVTGSAREQWRLLSSGWAAGRRASRQPRPPR